MEIKLDQKWLYWLAGLILIWIIIDKVMPKLYVEGLTKGNNLLAALGWYGFMGPFAI